MKTKVHITNLHSTGRGEIARAQLNSVETGTKAFVIVGTLDYIISLCTSHGYEIVNAQEVLLWLHIHVDLNTY